VQSYSQDLRDRVALDRGERPTAIARRLEVSRVWVYQVRRREQQTGQRTSFQIGGHRRSRIAAMEPVLRTWIEQAPGLSLPSYVHVSASRAPQSRSAPCGTR